MLRKLIIYLLGYYVLRLEKNGADRLLNICSKNDVKIWNAEKKEKGIIVYTYKKNYEKILEFSKKTETGIEILEEKGLPFLIHKYRKRKCFFIGFILFAFLVWKYTTFVWDINVEGEGFYSESEIEKQIKENYVTIGSRVRDVDCRRLEERLREDYPKISWISCELKGTQLNVTLTETVRDDLIYEGEEPCNIVASEDCIITDILVKNGVAVVETGDEVRKGDILITGIVNIYNEYDELIETNYVHASGIVHGRIQRDYKDEFELSHYVKNYTDETKSYYSLFVNDSLFEPFKPENKYVNYDIITNYKKIKIFDTFYLPVAVQKTIISEYEPKLENYTSEEACEKAKNKLSVYIDRLRKKGVEILENNVKISIVGGKCNAFGSIVTKELVGVPSSIYLFEQGEEESK